MKYYYVYVLRSQHKNFLYVGFTSDLRRRREEHNSGQELSTKAYSPFNLIHYEAYSQASDAKRREKYFKTTKGKTTLKTMLQDYFKEYPYTPIRVKGVSIPPKPSDSVICPICNGAKKAATQSFFTKSGKRLSGHLQICLTCKGRGWITKSDMEQAKQTAEA